jgi:hypothetical protein
MKPSRSRNLCFVAAVALGVLVAWTAVAPGEMPPSHQRTVLGGALCHYTHASSVQVPCSSRDPKCSSSSYVWNVSGTCLPRYKKFYRVFNGTSANCQSSTPGYSCAYILNKFYDGNCEPTW